ncbi:MAG: DsbA family protein [Alphaproteobacteria bacterium]|nr:DsbA family protein [Alphaproteobacteria bacterium]
MKNMFWLLLLWVGILTGGSVLAAPSLPTDEAMLADRVLGKAEAPVTILDYSSLTCPHCAAFATKILPSVKINYIDTGKVKLIYRDFPLDATATAAAMLARCVPQDLYYRFLDALFSSQAQWAPSANPKKALSNMARLSGMSEENINACLDDEALLKGVLALKTEAVTLYKIEATPSLVINGKTIAGVESYDELAKLIEAQLHK